MKKIPTIIYFFMTSAAAFFVLSPQARAQSFDKASAGTTSAQFLKIMASPQGSAMGEAYSAMANDSSAIDVNPACLLNIKKESLFLGHSQYLADTSLEFVSYSQNLGEETGAWGLAFKYFNWGKIERTDEGGGRLSSFSPYDVSVNVSFASYITGFNKDEEERFVFGGTGKIVRSKIVDADNAVSADMGLLTPYMFDKKFRMSLVAQNIMGALKFDRESFDLPMILRLGSVAYISDSFTATADLTAPKDSFFYFCMGGELRLKLAKKSALYLRGGFNTRNLFELSGFKNITSGIGLRFDEYTFDYAFTPYGELGGIHRLALSMNY